MYSFYKEEDEKRRKTRGPLSAAGSVLTMWQRCGKLGHGARRGYIRQAVAWHPCVAHGQCASACSVGDERSCAVAILCSSSELGTCKADATECVQVPPVVLPQEDPLLPGRST